MSDRLPAPQAVDLAEKALEQLPPDAAHIEQHLVFGRGLGLLAEGRNGDALDAFDRTLGYGNIDRSELACIQYFRGEALQKLGRFDEACTVWESLVVSDEQHEYGKAAATALQEVGRSQPYR